MNAHETYLEKRNQIKTEIEILKQKLEAMDIEENKDVNNWGYAGNCQHVLTLINELNYDFLREL